nr:hypothetical protein [uncultured Fluviicola sp.]
MDAKEPKDTQEQKETKIDVGGIQTYIVQPVMLPILPTSGPYLADTFNIDAAYSVSTLQLTVLMSFMIPGDLTASQVSIKQYFDEHEPNELQFYAVYSSESTAQMKEVSCKFKACATDAGGAPIDLGAILNVMTMMVNTVGPKTSRGTVCTVRTTEV